ncbi:MAG: hypothetical protein AMXMBFR80_13190 [Dehalococcoidia bacterium]
MDESADTRQAEPVAGPVAASRLLLPATLAIGAMAAGTVLALWSGGGPGGEALARIELVPAATPEVLVVVAPSPSHALGPEREETAAVSGPEAQTAEPADAGPPQAEPPAAAQSPAVDSNPASALAGVTIWSNGDSTSYYMTVALLAMVERAGGKAVMPPGYVVSSGLLNPGLHDWPANLAAAMAAYNPGVVVFMIGANDANGAAANPEAYRARVAALMDQLQAPGRQVAWVGQPTMGREDLAASVPVVNAIFREEAATRPWLTYVDAWAVTAGPAGGFATHLPGPGGELQLMRADDGVHLTPAAGERIARAVFEALFPGVPLP